MRKCHFKINDGDILPEGCKEGISYPGVWHQWSIDSRHTSHYPVGIVEISSGEVKIVSASNIIFDEPLIN